MTGKLFKGSKAVLLLRAKFERGEIAGKESSKSIRESESIFKEHKLSNFRACFNNMKREYTVDSKLPQS